MHSLVLALNPSIDCEWQVDEVRWEEKNTVASERRWAGGKGVNVARWLRHLGGKPQLLIPLGGVTGEELAGYLKAEELPAEIVPLRQSTRVNVIVTPASGGQLRFNPHGPKLSRDEWRQVLVQAQSGFACAGLMILSGSLPRGIPATAYAQLVRVAHAAGVRVLLDCDGPALAAAVKAKPFLVKPNEHELAKWWGKPLSSRTSIQRAAWALSEVTGGWVLVSLGKDGALLLNASLDCSLSARPPQLKAVNTVGAGDALLAAVALEIARKAPPAEWLRWGVATGAAATQCAAGCLPRLSGIRELAGRISMTTGLKV